MSFAGGRYRLEYPIGTLLYEPPGWITYARISPEGDRIAFLDHPRLGDLGGSVGLIDSAGKKTTLSSDWKSLQGLAWSSTGDEIWFTGSRTGTGGSSALYAVSLTGRERTVFSSPGTLKLNDISRDGQVLLTRGTTRGGIMALGAGGAKDRELSWFDYSTVGDLSADGKTLLFYEWGEGVGARPTIFIRTTDGSDAVRLGEGRPLALSRDGQWALAIQDDSPPQLVLLPTRTGEVRRLPRGVIAEYLDWAAWSPDGRRIYFAARDASDVRRTYVQEVDGGEPRPVTRDGFVGLLLSPDGRKLATVDRYGEYYVYPLDGGEDPQALAGYMDGDTLLQWTGDGKSLFVREADNLVLRIHRLESFHGSSRILEGAGASRSDRPHRHRLRSRTGPNHTGRSFVRLYVLDVRGRALPRSRFELSGGAQLLSRPVKSPSSCRRSTSAPAAASSSPRPWWWPSQTGQSSRRARRSLRRRA